MKLRVLTVSLIVALFAPVLNLPAETGYDAWLRCEQIDDPRMAQRYDSLPAVVIMLDDSAVAKTAQTELVRGVRGMLDRILRIENTLPGENAILIGTFDAVKKVLPAFTAPTNVIEDGFYLRTMAAGGHEYLVITGPNERGVLYGTFALLRKIALRESIT